MHWDVFCADPARAGSVSGGRNRFLAGVFCLEVTGSEGNPSMKCVANGNGLYRRQFTIFFDVLLGPPLKKALALALPCCLLRFRFFVVHGSK